MFCTHMVALSSFVEAFRSPVFRHGTDKNGFSLGFSKNMRQVFGDEKKYWLLPIFSRYFVVKTFRLETSESNLTEEL